MALESVAVLPHKNAALSSIWYQNFQERTTSDTLIQNWAGPVGFSGRAQA